jgi:hypothetical protein
VHRRDPCAVVHQVEPAIGARLEAEARGALGDRERGGGEVGEIGRLRGVEGEPRPVLAEAVDGPERRPVAPQAGNPPRPGQLGLGVLASCR